MEILKLFDPTRKKSWSIYKTTDENQRYVVFGEDVIRVTYTLESALRAIIENSIKK